MKVTNTSRRPTAEVSAIVKFVAAQHRFLPDTIDIVDSPMHKVFGGGLASQTARHTRHVTVRLSVKLKFPMLTQHAEEVGWIRVNSWEEELVLILAHEMRHVDQFASGLYYSRSQEAEMEVDAEEFAYKVLNRFRAASMQAQLAA